MRYAFDKLKLLIIAVGIVFAGFLFSLTRIGILEQNDVPAPENSTSPGPEVKIITGLIVDFGNGKTILHESIEVNAGETAYSVLLKKMNETGSSLETKSYDFGIMVKSIDGFSASDTHFWSYSVNGQTGSVAADKYILQDGDVVEWKYTPIQ